LLPGEHTIIVRSYAASGKYYDSKTVNVIVGLGQVSYTLISSNSVWKYLDDGSNQGEVWKYSLFDDSLWKSGKARLGYGGDGEVTLLNSGPSTNKYITYYFRRQFTVPSDVTITNLSF